MSLNKVQPSHGLQTPPKVSKAAGGEGASAAIDAGQARETVRLSDEGRMMSKLTDRSQPTPAKVRELSAALAGDLKNLFRCNAIDTRDGVRLDVDMTSGKVSVKGNRPDALAIAGLIDGQPQIARQVGDIVTLSGHVLASEQAAGSREAKQAAQAAAQIGSFTVDYASRLTGGGDATEFARIGSRRTGDIAGRAIDAYAAVAGSGASAGISLVFNGAEVQVQANGRPWISTRA